jgi:uncharacterized protein (UPF0548 family)
MIHTFLQSQAILSCTYKAVGATASTPPLGFAVDRARVQLGVGLYVFETAKAALKRWEEFRIGWVELHESNTEIKEGQVVAVLARVLGVWLLNACRIVYVVDEARRFGFAYGTLPDHAESGEERFLVEWSPEDGGVFYDILAFSRPQQFLTRWGAPLARHFQNRFRRDSTAAMIRAVAEVAGARPEF